MDKSWMKFPHRAGYVEGLENFIACARNHLDKKSRTRCPCNKCTNRVFRHIDEVSDHLYLHGMSLDYTHWFHHGEPYVDLTDGEEEEDDLRGGGGPGFEEMFEDIQASIRRDISDPDIPSGGSGNDYVENDIEENIGPFYKFWHEARQPLYPGSKIPMLDILVKLFHIKILTHSSIKSFDMHLQLIKSILPDGEILPKSHHEARMLLRNLGLGYIPIHACKFDCALFWKENEHLENCPICGEHRYKVDNGKGRRIPHKILRYFPLTQRLQRLFMSRMTAEDMRWHKEKRVEEKNVFRHPADSQVWGEFDEEYEWFASDSRNVRLGLASDGFNPFGNMNNMHSMWPVMVIPYNLPPWKCMKEPFIFMSLLIPGPKAPGNDIDVYLRPLVDELLDLWVSGVRTYDAVEKKRFQMHAALLWTVNDYPAYGNLSGWCTKGKLACPDCNKDTFSMYLKNGHKLCYMNHFRFLPPRHSLRSRARQLLLGINNVGRSQPEKLSPSDLLAQVQHLAQHIFGKNPNASKRKRSANDLNWTKKSVFFTLPYWPGLKLRHNLDVMHIEKNICESVLGTILNLDGKTKDSVKARLDLEALGIRSELHLIPNGNKFLVPAACYTFSALEKKSFCEWLKGVKFPDSYASNISRCVNVKDCKILGMKSHDCHVLLQRVLPVALRGFLNHDVSCALIELGFFFRELCCKTLRLEVLEKMEKDIAVILCKLEQIFPPSFFDVMVHLAVHLPREAILGGPVQYRWMYPIERFLRTLKQYVRNKARPEGSIAEAYIDAECISFCSMYLQGIETRFNREDRNYDEDNGDHGIGLDVFTQCVRPLGAPRDIQLNAKELEKVHYYILNNSDEISSYIEEHLEELTRESSYNLEGRRKKTLASWFKNRMQVLDQANDPRATEELYSLACGPDYRATRYSGCIVNGIRFHTRDRESNLQTQNSGVVVKGEHGSEDADFYGVLTDIIELEYLSKKRVFLFKCDWFDVSNRTGIRKDEHFTSINVSKTWYKEDEFVLATQAGQVFYMDDIKLRGSWRVVQKVTPRNVFDVPEKEEVLGDPGNEAYQQEEQVPGIEIQNEEVRISQLNRDDVNPHEVDAESVSKLRNDIGQNQSDEASMIDIINDEDDTLMDYYSEEEENILSDDETDIEE